MAQTFNHPSIAGLQFALGGGPVNWGAPGMGGAPTAAPMPYQPYNVGPAGPPPMAFGMGEIADAPARPTDGSRPPAPATPGKGGPGDIMGRLDKLEAAASPLTAGGAPMMTPGSQTMAMPMPGKPSVQDGAMRGLSTALKQGRGQVY